MTSFCCIMTFRVLGRPQQYWHNHLQVPLLKGDVEQLQRSKGFNLFSPVLSKFALCTKRKQNTTVCLTRLIKIHKSLKKHENPYRNNILHSWYESSSVAFVRFFFSSHKHHVFFCKLRTHKALETYCSGSEKEFTVVSTRSRTKKNQ